MRYAPPPPQPDPITQIVQRGWHENVIAFVRDTVPRLAIILLIAAALWRVVSFFVNRMNRLADRQVGSPQRAAQLRTVAAILRGVAYSIIGFIVLLQVLLLFGVQVGPLLASAGVVGVGIGLGAQSIFKDMLNGIFILLEDQYNVGEVVKIAGLQGSVEDLTLRCTTLRGSDGTLYIIPNSQIATVANLSRDFSLASLTISVDASADPDRVMTVLRQVSGEIRADAAFRQVILADPDVPGIDSINGREVLYPIIVRVLANQRDGVLRELRRRLIKTFESEGIPLGTASSMLIMQKSDPTTTPAAAPVGG